MPVAYLSPEWFDAADALLRGAGELSGVDDDGLAVEVVVTDGPAGTSRYVMRLARTGAHLDRDPAARGDVRLTQSWPVAVAVARGERSAQAAFLAAEIQLGGDVTALIAHASVVADLGDVLAPLRADTSY